MWSVLISDLCLPKAELNTRSSTTASFVFNSINWKKWSPSAENRVKEPPSTLWKWENLGELKKNGQKLGTLNFAQKKNWQNEKKNWLKIWLKKKSPKKRQKYGTFKNCHCQSRYLDKISIFVKNVMCITQQKPKKIFGKTKKKTGKNLATTKKCNKKKLGN